MDPFVTRLNELIEYLDITPIILAERMGIQRSTFSHLLSGRNRPGFEFMVRLNQAYPEINLNWLINGSGTMLVGKDSKISHTEIIEPKNETGEGIFANIFSSTTMHEAEPEKSREQPVTKELTPHLPLEKEVDRMVLVYKDGSIVEIKST